MIPLNQILIVCGLWCIADGIFSMIFVSDLRWKWQLARTIRIIVGVFILGAGLAL